MRYSHYEMFVRFADGTTRRFFDIVAVDRDAALADLAAAYGETPEVLEALEYRK